jgi:hypothetical protein
MYGSGIHLLTNVLKAVCDEVLDYIKVPCCTFGKEVRHAIDSSEVVFDFEYNAFAILVRSRLVSVLNDLGWIGRDVRTQLLIDKVANVRPSSF